MRSALGLWPRRVALAASVFLLVTAVSGTLASNVVAQSRAGGFAMATGADELKPTECSGIVVDTIATGSGSFSAPNSNDLVLGSAGVDTINARGGNDCVVGGSGNDGITGGNGTDVCIGGLGTDTFSGCETIIQ